MHTHTPNMPGTHTPQICQGYTLPPNIPGMHTPNTPGAHTHTSNIARTNTHTYTHTPNIPGRQTAPPPTPPHSHSPLSRPLGEVGELAAHAVTQAAAQGRSLCLWKESASPPGAAGLLFLPKLCLGRASHLGAEMY